MRNMQCPICKIDTDHRDFCTVRGGQSGDCYHLSRCGHCRLVYLDPMPPMEREEATADYDNKIRGYNRIFRYIKGLLIVRPIVRYVMRAIPGHPPHVLEVGMGAGWVAALWRDAGCRVEGVEPNPGWAEMARAERGFTVHETTFEDFCPAGAPFDVVVFDHVLEHFADPVGALEKAASMLGRGGLIVINTPNVESWSRKLLRRRWWWFVPNHKVFFSPASLAHIADRCGLRVEWMHHQLTTFSVLAGANQTLRRLGLPGLAHIFSPKNILLGAFLFPYCVLAKLFGQSEALTVAMRKP